MNTNEHFFPILYTKYLKLNLKFHQYYGFKLKKNLVVMVQAQQLYKSTLNLVGTTSIPKTGAD